MNLFISVSICFYLIIRSSQFISIYLSIYLSIHTIGNLYIYARSPIRDCLSLSIDPSSISYWFRPNANMIDIFPVVK